MAEGRGGDQIKAWVTRMGSSLRVEVRHLMISGQHKAAGTSLSTEPEGREKDSVLLLVYNVQ